MAKNDIAPGDRFGRWTVINESRPHYFLCRCDCGRESIVKAYYLKTGKSKSCGCYMRDFNKENRRKFPKDISNTRLYTIWNGIKGRCYTKSSTPYKQYGAKGISMCDDWKNNYMSFYNWAVSNGYSDELTLDRINSKGNYEPSNCRWVTYKQQANNTSKNLRFTYNGEEHTIHEWADIVGVNAMALRYRIVYAKWPLEKALTTPVKKKL